MFDFFEGLIEKLGVKLISDFTEKLIDFINSNERKSIPLEYFEENCFKLNIKYAPRLDYIKVLDTLIKENDNTSN